MSRVLVRLAKGLLTLYILGFTYAAGAQHIPYRTYIEHAEEAFEQKDFFNAFQFYEQALKFSHKDSLENLDRAAESAFHSWRLDTARHFLDRLVSGISDTCDERRMKGLYLLGLTNQRIGNYEDAKASLTEAVATCQSNSYRKKMTDLIASLSWALQQKDSTSFVKVNDFLTDTTEHFLAPVYYENQVLYTRQFFDSQKQADFIHQVGQIKLASSSHDSLLRSNFDGAKSDITIGFPSFDFDCKRIYYASCKPLNTRDHRCEILTRTYDTGNYDSLYLGPVDTLLTDKSISYTHPNFVQAPTGKGLYYVKDSIKGKKGSDILFASLTEMFDSVKIDSIIYPKNINSEADEVSPFYDSSTKSIFFSSDRLDDCRSFGGMDIYQAFSDSNEMNNFNFRTVRILPTPINSMKNDVFFVKKDSRTAMFSSNRRDATVSDSLADACCYNLYESVVPPCQIYFYPYIQDYCSSKALDPVTDEVEVQMFEICERYNRKSVVDRIQFDPKEKRFPVERASCYILTLAKNGYKSDTFDVYIGADEFLNKTPYDLCPKSCTFLLQPELSKLAIVPSYRCFPSGFPQPLENCNVVLQNAIDTIPHIQKSGYEFEINVAEQDTYYLTITHPDFTSYHDTVVFRFQQRDSCYKKIYPIMNQEISLYFENDVPEPSANLAKSELSYVETWSGSNGYKDQEGLYKQRYTADTSAVEAFFQRARQEYETYDSLKVWLERKLKNRPNSKVVLLLEGRASPIATNTYNWQLSQRRIHSIERDIGEDDRLKGYYKSQRIIFRRIPGALGEERSEDVSDDKKNLVESVYNPKAARERRITIRIIPASCLPRIDN